MWSFSNDGILPFAPEAKAYLPDQERDVDFYYAALHISMATVEQPLLTTTNTNTKDVEMAASKGFAWRSDGHKKLMSMNFGKAL